MSEYTWGDLPKNQIDPQLISQAIDQAILNHESDPQAHLGAGESLQAHRQNETLDHPASSIPADKITSKYNIMTSNFESLDSFQKTVGAVAGFPCFKLTTTAVLNNIQHLYGESYGGLYGIDFAKSPLFQLTIQLPALTNLDFYFGAGYYFPADDNLFLGFIHTGGAFKAVVAVGTIDYTANLTTPDTEAHIYRAMIDPFSHDALFFIDGVLVATISSATFYASAVAVGDIPNSFYVSVKTKTTATKEILGASLLLGTSI